MRPIKEIAAYPQVRGTVHESCYRSFHILEMVKEMLERGDSKETIKEFIKQIEDFNFEEEHTN